MNDVSCISNNNLRPPNSLEELKRPDVEEADVKLMLHINNASKEGFNTIYLISSDTDVVVLTMYFWQHFKKKNGLRVKIL